MQGTYYQNDGHVFEDGENIDSQVLESLGTGVDDHSKQEADREPSFGVCHVEVTKVDDAQPLHCDHRKCRSR